jgi:hypothetical protein
MRLEKNQLKKENKNDLGSIHQIHDPSYKIEITL